MKKDDTSLGVLPVKNNEDDERKKKLSGLKDMIEMFQSTWTEQIEIMAMRAKIDKAYYDSLVQAGFTKEEAMEIVKSKGLGN